MLTVLCIKPKTMAKILISFLINNLLMMDTTIFLCGDIMTGRGIDQILPHPSTPKLYEDYVKDARVYVALSEKINGHILKPVNYDYIWGKALFIFDIMQPNVKIINLETSITTSNRWENKGINYRMHPANIECLTSAKIDCCTLANNHILDWGYEGLEQSLEALHHAKIQTVGAGRNLPEAEKPGIIPIKDTGRILIFALGIHNSGIPKTWEVSENNPGVHYLDDLSLSHIDCIANRIQSLKQPMDVVILSIHWGANWGYDIANEYREFARSLIDKANVDIVYGHSSHHFKGLEYYHGKLILYGCGDFINDYEGIQGHESFRSNLVLMYFPRLNLKDGTLLSLEIYPLKLKNFCLQAPSKEEVEWVLFILNRESNHFGAEFYYHQDSQFPSVFLKIR
jgi:poly-gamma-glutamate synthesis protein (capsule biosynthesis protein)